MKNDNYNPDTVGTATPAKPLKQTISHTFGEAIEHMRDGGYVRREGWNGTGMYAFKQVPSKVPANIVPKMSSLPQSVKDRMQLEGVSPDYQNQMVIVKPDGSIDNWVASSSDTFALDWILG